VSDTPKTDALLNETATMYPDAEHNALVALARNLERENAALRADLLIEEERSIYWRDNEGKAMAENAALRADKERLDWLEDTDRRHGYIYKSRIVENRWFEGAKTVRAAIDAARKEEQL
jgi:hypothetical protein